MHCFFFSSPLGDPINLNILFYHLCVPLMKIEIKIFNGCENDFEDKPNCEGITKTGGGAVALR